MMSTCRIILDDVPTAWLGSEMMLMFVDGVFVRTRSVAYK